MRPNANRAITIGDGGAPTYAVKKAFGLIHKKKSRKKKWKRKQEDWFLKKQAKLKRKNDKLNGCAWR